ncbi:MAG: hypothetical protein ABSA75_10155 [Candidatus Bathyarchaeia archaeon]
MTRQLIINIDDELEKEMSKYPEIDWVEAAQKLLRQCIHRKQMTEMYTAPVERALQEEKEDIPCCP